MSQTVTNFIASLNLSKHILWPELSANKSIKNKMLRNGNEMEREKETLKRFSLSSSPDSRGQSPINYSFVSILLHVLCAGVYFCTGYDCEIFSQTYSASR